MEPEEDSIEARLLMGSMAGHSCRDEGVAAAHGFMADVVANRVYLQLPSLVRQVPYGSVAKEIDIRPVPVVDLLLISVVLGDCCGYTLSPSPSSISPESLLDAWFQSLERYVALWKKYQQNSPGGDDADIDIALDKNRITVSYEGHFLLNLVPALQINDRETEAFLGCCGDTNNDINVPRFKHYYMVPAPHCGGWMAIQPELDIAVMRQQTPRLRGLIRAAKRVLEIYSPESSWFHCDTWDRHHQTHTTLAQHMTRARQEMMLPSYLVEAVAVRYQPTTLPHLFTLLLTVLCCNNGESSLSCHSMPTINLLGGGEGEKRAHYRYRVQCIYDAFFRG